MKLTSGPTAREPPEKDVITSGRRRPVDENHGFVRTITAQIQIGAAGSVTCLVAILLGRRRAGVAFQDGALQKSIEINHAAAGDLFAIVNRIGQRVIFRAGEVQISNGCAVS